MLITTADFGQSYASQSLDKATEFYHSEIECVNAAATVARGLGAKGQWVLSVGATPTAHAATQIKDGQMDLEGELELYVLSSPTSLPVSPCSSCR